MNDHAGSARRAVEDFIAQVDAPTEQLGPDSWWLSLTGVHKRTIGVHLRLGERTLIIESHFMRAPDEHEDELYELLLKKHQRSYVLRFCIYDDGDVMIVGALPLAAVTSEELDRIAGSLLTLADETFRSALRLGFSAYIEREQEWRERTGQQRNPIT